MSEISDKAKLTSFTIIMIFGRNHVKLIYGEMGFDKI